MPPNHPYQPNTFDSAVLQILRHLTTLLFLQHTAFPNTSARDRCCLIASYKTAGGCGEGTNARAVSGQIFGNAKRLDASGALQDRAHLRTLLGLDVDYHSEAWHLSNPTPDNM
eukprot:SAG11_NODE_1324_length_5199_cov_5.524902_4_plen_113_part_00